MIQALPQLRQPPFHRPALSQDHGEQVARVLLIVNQKYPHTVEPHQARLPTFIWLRRVFANSQPKPQSGMPAW